MQRILSTFLAAVAILFSGCAGDAPTHAAGADDFGVQATTDTGVIRGVVVDEALRPLASVTVTVLGRDQHATSDGDGRFAFDGLPSGAYQLEATRIGFEAAQVRADVVAGLDAPRVVKLQLVSLGDDAPFVEATSYAIFIGYAFAAGANGTGPTGGGGIPLLSGGEDPPEVYFDGDLPDWYQAELVWESTQLLGDRMELAFLSFPDGAVGFKFAKAGGTSPLPLGQSREQLQEAQIGSDVPIDVSVFGNYDDTAPAGAGFTLQQEVQLLTHAFYRMTPPDGWQFTAHGEPRADGE